MCLPEQLPTHKGGMVPEQISATRLSFRNTLSLLFLPSELRYTEAGGITTEMLETGVTLIITLEEGVFDPLATMPTFFGVLGGQGALPLCYTEIVVERESFWRGRATHAFFGILPNWATTLFYPTRKKYRLPS